MENSNKSKLLVLFSYCGLKYNGNDRDKQGKTIETDLLAVLAAVVKKHSDDPIEFLSLSRALVTEPGESAAVQAISFFLENPVALYLSRRVDKINRNLSKRGSIIVISASIVHSEFSARRDLQQITYEYLLPTYVFSKPPSGTYFNTSKPEKPPSIKTPPPGFQNVFTSIKRSVSVRTPGSRYDENCYPDDSFKNENMDKSSLDKPSNTPTLAEQLSSDDIKSFETLRSEKPEPPSKENKSLLASLKRLFSKKKQEKPILRSKTLQPSKQNSEFQSNDNDKNKDTGIISNLKKSLSIKSPLTRSKTESSKQVYMGVSFTPIQDDQNIRKKPQYFEPLEIPAPTPTEIQNLKDFRINADQFDTFSKIIQLFMGTHNFHNYTVKSNTHQTMFQHIIAFDCDQPILNNGLEWIKLSIASKSFSQFQFRKMISMAVMVTRTQTPRSIVGNSFGAISIDIPEFPPFGMIQSGIKYIDSINPDYLMKIHQIKNEMIIKEIFEFEEKFMSYEPFIRSLDSYSFLYSHYLNPSGIISEQNEYTVVTA